MLISHQTSKKPPNSLFESSISSIKSATRSSFFISTFITIIWSTICLARNFSQDENIGPQLASFLCGWSFLIEKPDRRHEIALYCLPRALYGYFSRKYVQHKWKYFQNIEKPASIITQILLLSATLGSLIYRSRHKPQTVRKSVKKMIEFLYIS